MFREMLRKKQQITNEECIKILKEEPRGVLSVIGDNGYPYGMPINHYYCEEDGKLYFHSGMKGHKIDAITRCDKASYCVYDSGYRRDREKVYTIARRLSYKFTDDEEYIEREIKHAGPRTLMFALVPEHMTGKLVNEA